jgi:hypothetical protein
MGHSLPQVLQRRGKEIRPVTERQAAAFRLPLLWYTGIPAVFHRGVMV